MSKNQLKAALLETRLRSHRLLGNTLASPEQTVAWMGAVQAQDFNAAKWAVGVRTSDCSELSVTVAFNAGQILRTHVLRPTWHLVAAQDIRWMCALSADKVKSALRANDKVIGTTDALRERANALIVDTLKGGNQLSGAELGVVLKEAGLDTTGNRLYHYLINAEANSLICSGELRGNTQTYAIFDERVPLTVPISREESTAKLAKAYLQSHAPASLDDFCWWSGGITKTEARNAIAAVGATEQIGGDGRVLYTLEPQDEPEPTVTEQHRVVLLPAFDEYIVAYSNRDDAIDRQYRERAITSNGIFRPLILVRGEAVGTWRKGTAAKCPIELSYFTPPSATLERQVQTTAVERFHAF